MTNETYWTYERDGVVMDMEKLTKEDAQDAADSDFEEECEDFCEHGEYAEDDINLIKFKYDEDSGERVVLKKIASSVSYQDYHGDFYEHTTYRGSL